jgi:ribosome-associated heat shock protein Hsp15
MTEPRATIRLDKWLWYARFFKTRTLSAKQIAAGHVRVNSVKVSKGAVAVGVGDTLTFAQAREIRVVEIADLGTRRGPAAEAQVLYRDLTPKTEPTPKAPRFDGGGRPSKQQRRELDKFRSR